MRASVRPFRFAACVRCAPDAVFIVPAEIMLFVSYRGGFVNIGRKPRLSPHRSAGRGIGGIQVLFRRIFLGFSGYLFGIFPEQGAGQDIFVAFFASMQYNHYVVLYSRRKAESGPLSAAAVRLPDGKRGFCPLRFRILQGEKAKERWTVM